MELKFNVRQNICTSLCQRKTFIKKTVEINKFEQTVLNKLYKKIKSLNAIFNVFIIKILSKKE